MSSFIDTAEVQIKAGDGGNGLTSFRREKFVDRGGPDGGDGGRGGNVVAVATRNLSTLQGFRHIQKLLADDGQSGGPQKKHGRNGEDLEVFVPVGTVIRNGDVIVADMDHDGQRVIIASGGHGGFGNAHFVSSTRQAPRIAETGEPGDGYTATLELKLLADVGLVGLPNAGKSTFLSVVSNAKPEIADYPFTTLVPNLGVADVDQTSLLIADIPGLIEGASQGKGLGDDFLRHVERTAVLLHLIDAYTQDIADAYKTIQNELKTYTVDLTRKPQIVAITKTEGLDDDIVKDQLSQLQAVVPASTPLFAISASAHIGIKEVLRELKSLVDLARAKEIAADKKIKPKGKNPAVSDWVVTWQDDHWQVSGAKIQKFARRTDFANEWGVHRLHDILKRLGITRELTRQGAKRGNIIRINGVGSDLKF
jgi:GTP-binding protein